VGVIGLGFVGTAVSTGLQFVAEIREYDKFKDSESLYDVVNNSDILFFCLPTPMREDGGCDTSIIEQVALEVDKVAEERKVCVVKSTVPPGTTRMLAQRHDNHAWVFNPEFLTQANFIEDFMNQDRILIGTVGESKVPKPIMDLYFDFMDKHSDPGACLFANSSDVVEMVKYMTNCFLASKVSFFNEMREICDSAEIDHDSVIDFLQLDKRIGKSHMRVPGPDGKHGFGGACFPKDINALMAFAHGVGVYPMMLETAWTKNLMVREESEWEDLAQVNGKYEEK
jgi:UDPglucose 6-dehydrogenase